LRKLIVDAREWEVVKISGHVCFDMRKDHGKRQIHVEVEGQQEQRWPAVPPFYDLAE
jgi:hypothetical protein